MRNINFSDHLEERIAIALEEAGIEFIHESEDRLQVLDFYLPFFDVYLEIKQFHADRISKQMSTSENVIAIQGRKAVELLDIILLRSRNKST